MPIVTPGKRPGVRLSKSQVYGKKFVKGKRSGYSNLQLTPMVDMFIIIVLYLIQNFSADGEILFMSSEIQLPSITSKLQLDRAPVVAISRGSEGLITVDGSRVVDVSDLLRDDLLNVPALEEALREKRRSIEESNAMIGGEGFKGVVNIQADKGTEFKVLKKVMTACSQAGFSNINFAGMQTSNADGEAVTTAANL